ncbi:response regulator transcription factor [Noviherbaspirillum galbum]|uniref:Response regulator transcription factor n=1 Tax=Noviherbaspirillum galbum TaxID=2709383 RepID=A0A6B3SKI3_9BURK|nr:response regulator transcription factor [Noviherbaspirillum galbum]NEX61267.1 response regulator transcription factor [Noviherbaspirillum galbum]
MHIAIVASPEQAERIGKALERHACTPVLSTAELLEHARRHELDGIVADWRDGMADLPRAVAETMKRSLPILALVERDATAASMAMRAGCGDYVFRPWRAGELAVRVDTLLRLAYPDRRAESLRVGEYAFDLEARSVSRRGQAIAMTQKEVGLALLFFRNLGRPLSRAYLQEHIWAGEPELQTRTIDTHVSRVRTKLALLPENGYRLAPVYSFGYRLERLEGKHDNP